MKTQIVEVTNGPNNWGKFLVGQFNGEEYARKSVVDEGADLSARSLVSVLGWSSSHFLLLDLQTGEGAIFRKGGYAAADLDKHRVWVCPMFQPFLEWLYARADLVDLPAHVDLPDAPFAMYGYRRPGPNLNVVAEARRMVAAGGSHECGEWTVARGVCLLCDRAVVEETIVELLARIRREESDDDSSV